MSYKKYLLINGKRFGPYNYESYRDKKGNVKKRYIGKYKDSPYKLIIKTAYIFLILLFFISLAFIVIYFSTNFILEYNWYLLLSANSYFLIKILFILILILSIIVTSVVILYRRFREETKQNYPKIYDF